MVKRKLAIVVLDSFAADQRETGAWAALRKLGDVAIHPHLAGPPMIDRCRDAEAVVTNKAVIGAQVIAAARRLRYIGVSATGTNVVDLAAARARGIAVTNVPGYSSASVAQHAFALVLHFFSRVAGHADAVRAGRWASSPDFCLVLHPLAELEGKTLVTVGQGAIGGAVARIARGFGMNVVAAAVPGSPTPGRTPLQEALPRADVATLHCPLTPATANLVDARFLDLCKPDAVLINTSRGGLVDEAALVAALDAGRLRGVGLDVLGAEPPPADHPLCDPNRPWASRVVVTPHIAWATVESRARLRAEAASNLRAFLAGDRRNRVD